MFSNFIDYTLRESPFKDCKRKEMAPRALDDLACKQLYDYSLKAVGLA